MVSHCFDLPFPLTNGVEHLFMFLLAIRVSDLETCMYMLCPFLNWVIFFIVFLLFIIFIIVLIQVQY